MQPISSFSYTLLSVAISTAMTQAAWAKSTEQSKNQLDAIEVIGEQDNALNENIITSNQDLTRYSTDMGVPETGRFGAQGFNIRGVEGNQVAMTIDGVSQAPSNNYTVLSRYSYYNKARIQAETDLMGSVEVEKGSSTTAGNGALGGAVNYQTKSVKDILLKDRQLGGVLKYTYNGRNREHIKTVGVAADSQYVDGLVMYSHHAGTETQIPSKGPDIMGYGRGVPNPYDNDQYSYLAKIGFKFNDQHRLELKALKQRSKNDGIEFSYSPTTLRKTQDIQALTNYGITYAYTPKMGLFESVKVDLNKQKTEMSGRNDQHSATQAVDVKRTFVTSSLDSTLKATLKPVKLGAAQHVLATQLGYSKSDFRFDKETYKIQNMGAYDDGMQPPARSQNWSLLLGDNIQWGQALSARINVRYDRTKLTTDNANLSSKTFNNWSGDAGLAYQMTSNWQVAYKLSRGFRTPTAIEMFFDRAITGYDLFATFAPPGVTYHHRFKFNPNLKPETSIGNEISLSGNGRLGRLNVTAYHTQYKNIIDLAELMPAALSPPPNYVGEWQYQNIQKAKITGIDVNSTLDLNAAWNDIPQGFELNSGFGYAKGKRNDGADLLSVQPLKALFGLGYRAPNNDWAVHLNATYTQGKKAKDAQHYALIDTLAANGAYISHKNSLSTYPYLSNSATVFDLVAHKKFGESAVIKAGVYNLFNKKYWTWDSLRTINDTNPTLANRVTGDGLNRFLAPERYAMVSVEFKF